MKKQIKLTLTMILIASVVATSMLFAADGSWALTGDPADGQWMESANWIGGIPNAAGDNAYFTNNIGGTAGKITVIPSNDANIVVGGIYLNSTRVKLPSRTNIYNGDYFQGATNITLDAGGSTPIIDVSSNRLDAQVVFEGTDGFTLLGEPNGVLMLGATPKLISGPVLLQGAGVVYNDKNALMNADVTITNTTLINRKGGFNTKSLAIGDAGVLDFDQNSDFVSPVQLYGPATINQNGRMELGYDMILSGSNIVVNNGGELNCGGTWGGHNFLNITINNPLTLEGYGILGIGALAFPGINNLTNNGPITLTGNTRIGMWGGGDAYIVMNGAISGTGPCRFLAQAGHHTHIRRFELFAQNNYTEDTWIEGHACQNITTLHGDHC